MSGRVKTRPGVNLGRAALITLGAALLGTTPAQAGGTSAGQAAARPAAYSSSELRLAEIGYRLAKANAKRCAQPEMLSGLMLHDMAGYDAETRPQVTRAYGLTTGFGVLRLVPGSAAARAGFRVGDEITALNGADITNFSRELIGRQASSDRNERFADLLETALRKGQATMAVRRAGATVSLALEADQGCGGRFVATPDNHLNAWTDGRYIAVTAKMMRSADDPELAFVVAHEMAHNILGHTGPRGTGISQARAKAAEAEADAMAIELLASADYDLAAPARFLRRTGKLQFLTLSLDHPSNSQRIKIVDASIAKFERTRLAANGALAAVAGCPQGAAACLSDGKGADHDADVAPTQSDEIEIGSAAVASLLDESSAARKIV